MKCQYCGGDVALDDRFCPHCGREADQSIRHQQEMEHYASEFEKTRKEALQQTQRGDSSGITAAIGIRLAILAGLFIAMIVLIVRLDPYSLNERKLKREVASNKEYYKGQVETLLEERDYAKLYALNQRYHLGYEDGFKEYRYILNAVDSYYRSCQGMMELVYLPDGESRVPYHTETLAKYVTQFYTDISPDQYEQYAEDPERTAQVAGQMEEEMQKMLRSYLGISKEDAASFGSLSRSRQTVLIENALDEKLGGTHQTDNTDQSEAEQTEAEQGEDSTQQTQEAP